MKGEASVLDWSMQPAPEKHDRLPHEQWRARRPQTAARLKKSQTDRLLLGVLGGVAEFTGLPSRWLRLGFALTVPASGGVTLAGYLFLALLLPASVSQGE